MAAKGWLKKRGTIWWWGFQHGGKRIERSSGSERKSGAQRQLQAALGNLQKDILPPRRLSFEDAAADLVNDYKTNGRKSLAHAERRLKLHLSAYFGGRALSKINTADVRSYVASRQDAGASNASINRELALLKRMFTLARQAEKIAHMPYVPMLAENNVRTGFFEREQFEAVRRHLPEALRPVATFMYLTGWRKSEVLGLEWRQVDLQAGTVRLDAGQTKNGKGRVFPFAALDEPDELRTLLQEQQQEAERLKREGVICRWVFHRQGKGIKSYDGAWRTACEAAGVPGKIAHDFRRTAARDLVRAGVGESVAMKLTGHLTRSVFDRYNVTSDNDLRDAAAKLNAARGETKVRQSADSDVKATA